MSYVNSVRLLAEDLKTMSPSGVVRLAQKLEISRQAIYAWNSPAALNSERYAKSLFLSILETTRGCEEDIHQAARHRFEQGAPFTKGDIHVN
jgi:hypothetical protein